MSNETINERSDDYVQKLNRLLATDRNLLKNLRSYKSEIIAFSETLKATRPMSLTLKIGGAVSVIAGTALIPLTLGVSSSLIGLGTGAIVGGRVMDMIRNFIDSTETKEQMAKLRRYADEHDKIANELKIAMVKLVDCLGTCASNNVPLAPTRNLLVTMGFALQCGLLIPTVRQYVQSFLSSSLSHLFPSINLTSFMRFTSGLAVTLNCLSAVCTVLECIYEFQEILENRPHPSAVKAQSLIDAISEEVEQLVTKIELFAD